MSSVSKYEAYSAAAAPALVQEQPVTAITKFHSSFTNFKYWTSEPAWQGEMPNSHENSAYDVVTTPSYPSERRDVALRNSPEPGTQLPENTICTSHNQTLPGLINCHSHDGAGCDNANHIGNEKIETVVVATKRAFEGNNTLQGTFETKKPPISTALPSRYMRFFGEADEKLDTLVPASDSSTKNEEYWAGSPNNGLISNITMLERDHIEHSTDLVAAREPSFQNKPECIAEENYPKCPDDFSMQEVLNMLRDTTVSYEAEVSEKHTLMLDMLTKAAGSSEIEVSENNTHRQPAFSYDVRTSQSRPSSTDNEDFSHHSRDVMTDEEFARKLQAEEDEAMRKEVEQRRARLLEDEIIAASIAAGEQAPMELAYPQTIPPRSNTEMPLAQLDERLRLENMSPFEKTFGIPFALDDDDDYKQFVIAQQIQRSEQGFFGNASDQEDRAHHSQLSNSKRIGGQPIENEFATTPYDSGESLHPQRRWRAQEAHLFHDESIEDEKVSWREAQRLQEEENARWAQRLQEEENAQWAVSNDAEQASDELYAHQIQLEEEQRRAVEEDASERLARELQVNDNGGDFSAYYDDYNPYAEKAVKLNSLFPYTTLSECFDALEKANFDENQAVQLLAHFPKLPGTSHRVLFEKQNTFSVDATIETMLKKYGRHIPPQAIHQAAEQALGDPDAAENILFSKYPDEMVKFGMHSKSSFTAKKDSEASAGSGWRTSASAYGDSIRITKAQGLTLASPKKKIHRNDNANTMLEDAIEDIDNEYLALTMRPYTAEDLVRACERFGCTSANGTAFGSMAARENQILYDSLRNRVREYSENISKAYKMSAAANQKGWTTVAQDWRAKADQLKLRCTAASIEAADCLFAQKNPTLVYRLENKTMGEEDDDELKVDLHMLHVHEAEDRVIALLSLASIKGWRKLKIITGKGLHSDRGGPKILPRIASLLRNNRTVVQSFTEGEGHFVVKVKPSIHTNPS